MNSKTNEELIECGLILLSSALSHFLQVKDNEHGTALANVASGLLSLGECVQDLYKNKK